MAVYIITKDLTPEADLSAVGNSSSVDVSRAYHHTVQTHVNYEDGGDDNVTLVLQGSVDNETNWFTLPLKNTDVVGATVTTNTLIIDAPGDYALQCEAKVQYLRLRASALSATTAAISGDYFGGN